MKIVKSIGIGLLFFLVTSCNKEQPVKLPVAKETPAQLPQSQPLSPPQEPVNHFGEPIGSVNGLDLAYDCYGCLTASADSIIVYSKKANAKKILFTIPTGDYYINEASIIILQHQPFIYINSGHTHGHLQGYLYALDTQKVKAYKVTLGEDNFKIPDSLYIRNFFGLTRDEKTNTFGFGASLRPKNSPVEYIFSGKYKLVKQSKNKYQLKPYGETISK